MRRSFALIALASLATPALADLSLKSDVPGLDLVALASLPAAPKDQGEAEFCADLFVETTTTPGGQDAAAKGWHVTAEVPFGDLTAISFVGSATPATSGTCELSDGNIGLYSGSQLIALLYSTQPDALMIGRIRPFGDGLRILSGDVLPGTSADLVRAGEAVTVTAPATEEPVCNGTATIPQIEGQPIDKARKTLMRAGWQPVPGDPAQQALGWAKDLAAAGVPEVQDCSGTGFAFCAFSYAGAAGDLSVTTAGEGGEDGSLPTVNSYGVDCH
jgi:hypothetical protein